MHLLSLLIAPLQAVVLFFAPHAPAVKPAGARVPARTLATAYTSVPACTSAPAAGPAMVRARGQRGRAVVANSTALSGYPPSPHHAATQPVQRVRLVRNVDASLPPDRAGRMVVSGRFADVCAELDKLAAMGMRAA